MFVHTWSDMGSEFLEDWLIVPKYFSSQVKLGLLLDTTKIELFFT